jgi:23S rRNA G2069 N7-methylase RlmK/C1962 C5-methylase RlmI
MSLKRDYRTKSHTISGRSGPGGIACTCCNAYGCHPRGMKHLTRRALRRASRQAIKAPQEVQIDD